MTDPNGFSVTFKDPSEIPSCLDNLRLVAANPIEAVRAFVRDGGDPAALAVKLGPCNLDFHFSERLAAGENVDVQASDLAELITLATGLLKLELGFARVVGDISLVQKAISRCKTLQLFTWIGHPPEDASDTIALGETFANRASLPPFGLAVIDIENLDEYSEKVVPRLRSFYQLKNQLCTGCFGCFRPTGTGRDGFMDCLEAMAKATKMEFLYFGFLGFPYLEALTDTVVKKMTWLKTLLVSVGEETSIAPLAHALKNHKSLKDLTICFGRNINEEEVKAFLAVIKDNNFILEKLEFQFKEEFPASPAVLAIVDAIEFYLTLNRLGRAKLLAPAEAKRLEPEAHLLDEPAATPVVDSADEWIQAVAAEAELLEPGATLIVASTSEWIKPIVLGARENNPSVIFYFLTKNPAIIPPKGTPIAKIGGSNGPKEEEDATTETGNYTATCCHMM